MVFRFSVAFRRAFGIHSPEENATLGRELIGPAPCRRIPKGYNRVLRCLPLWWERSLRWCRRNPAVASLLSALAGVTLVGATMVIWSWRDAVSANQQTTEALDEVSEQKSVAVRAAVAAKEQAAKAIQAQKETEAANRQLKDELRRTALARYALTLTFAFHRIREGHLLAADELLEECPYELIGWEYGYLRGLCEPQTFGLQGHTDGVTATAFSGDRRRLATASRDQTIRIWDVAARKQVALLQMPGTPVVRLAFSPDGSRIVAGQDSVVAVLEIQSGKVLWSTNSPRMDYTALHFSPDGAQVLASGRGGLWKRWQAQTGKEIPSFPLTGVEAVISPDAAHVALVKDRGGIELWSIAAKQVVAQRPPNLAHTYADSSLRFVPNGQRLYFTRLFRGGSSRETFDLGQNVWSSDYSVAAPVAYAADGRLGVGPYGNGMLAVWDMTKNQRMMQLALNGCDCLNISPDGAYAVAATPDHRLRLIRTVPEVAVTTSIAPTELASATGAYTASVRREPGADNKLRHFIEIRERNTNQMVHRLPGQSAPPPHLHFSPDSKLFVCVHPGEEPRICVWDMKTGAQLHQLPALQARVTALVFHPDGRLVSFDIDGAILVWDVRQGKLQHAMDGHRGSVRASAFTPDRRWLISLGWSDRTVRLWDMSTGKEVHCLRHRADVDGFNCSPDGRLLVTRSGNDYAMWDLRAGELMYTKEKRSSQMPRESAFSPDGTRLVYSEPSSGNITIWDTSSGQELLALPHADGDLSFSDDGKHLYATSKTLRTAWRSANIQLPSWRIQRTSTRIVAAAQDVLFTAGRDSRLLRWDLRTGKPLPGVVESQVGLRDAAVSRDGKRIALIEGAKAGPEDQGKLRVVDTDTGHDILTGLDFDGRLTRMTFNPDGTKLGVFRADSNGGYLSASVWDLTTGARIQHWRGKQRGLAAGAFSPTLDGILVRRDRAAHWVDLASGAELTQFDAPSSLDGYIFTHAGTHVAGANHHSHGRDPIRIWDLETLQERTSIPGAGPISFHPSDEFLACRGANNTIELWDLARTQRITSFRAHPTGVGKLFFSADGMLLVAGAKAWDVSKWLPRAESQPTRPVVVGRHVAECWNRRGRGHAARQQHDRALQCFAEALRLNPDCFESHWARGRLNWTLERFDQATRDFENALRLRPKDALLAALVELVDAAAAPRPFRILAPDFGRKQTNLTAAPEFDDGSVVERLRDLGFNVVVVPWRNFDPNSMSDDDVLLLPNHWAAQEDRYDYFESKKDDFHAFVKRGGGLLVCRPHPHTECTPTLLPYPVTFENRAGRSSPRRINLTKQTHYITSRLPDMDMPFSADSMIRIDKQYETLALQFMTQRPSLAVCRFGNGRVVVQTANDNVHAYEPLADEILRRMVLWAAGREPRNATVDAMRVMP